MQILAAILVLAVAQQPPDGIVTIKKKSSIWSFKITPEGRKKVVVDLEKVDSDVPQKLHVAWALEEAPAATRNPFEVSAASGAKTVNFYREGKSYPELQADAGTLLAFTREELSDLQKSMIEEFYQFDLDFPGGSWEELARLLCERVAAAYEQQFPEILKPFLPGKVEIELSTKSTHHARYPAIQAKAVTFAQLRKFGPQPLVAGKSESTPHVVEQEDKSISLVMSVLKSPGKFTLADGNAVESLESLDVAFFHLGNKPALPGADHVVALFELAWKARGGPLYAKVKYHPETKTLMVQGTIEEIESADKVFATLTGRPAPVAPSLNPFDSLNQTLQKIAELIEKQNPEKDKDK